MPKRKEYTVTDARGETVGTGDNVHVSFVGSVRSVTKEGYLIIRLPDGTTAHYDPSYQQLVKVPNARY